MILKIFLYGMIIAVIAAFVEISISESFFVISDKVIEDYSFLHFLLYSFLGIAFVEEFLKYLVVRQTVLKNSELDEPTDVMLYMIIAALGFAALENILVLFSGEKFFLWGELFHRTIMISSLRFIGATFLHALCAGTLGYFWALSIYETKKRTKLIISGLLIATFLHGLYNLFIIEMVRNPYFIWGPIIILITLAFFVSYGFKKLKRIKSICKTT